jgi:hypothetical protein
LELRQFGRGASRKKAQRLLPYMATRKKSGAACIVRTDRTAASSWHFVFPEKTPFPQAECSMKSNNGAKFERGFFAFFTRFFELRGCA